MGQKRSSLEWQLSRAGTQLATCEKELDGKGLATAARAKHPKWRNLNALCRQLRNRLNAVGKIAARDQAILAQKAAATSEAE